MLNFDISYSMKRHVYNQMLRDVKIPKQKLRICCQHLMIMFIKSITICAKIIVIFYRKNALHYLELRWYNLRNNMIEYYAIIISFA